MRLFYVLITLFLGFRANSQGNIEDNDLTLIYENTLASSSEVSDWKMEGPGTVDFNNKWMHMNSPGEEGHHVFWCPQDFPGDFVAEWELQNLETDAGLVIVFFSTIGDNGKDIFDPSIKKRDGVFKKYTRSDLNCYHISYYANADGNQREISHLRKNSGFHLVHQGELGIPIQSQKIHIVRLVKIGSHIRMYIDSRKIIDWIDDGKTYGSVLSGGKIGFRQMRWSHFRYRNFKVWTVNNGMAKSWPRHTIDSTSNGADGVKSGDINNDGRLDLVVGWEEGALTKLYTNPGRQHIKSPWPSQIVGETPNVEDVLMADLDGDRQEEIISCTEGQSQKIFVHTPDKGSKDKWIQVSLPAAENKTKWMYATHTQIDNRGLPDLVAGGKGTLGWFEAPAKSRQWNKWKWHEISKVGWLMSLLETDMDGDGDTDLLITDRYGDLSACRWLENPNNKRSRKKPWSSHVIGANGLQSMFITTADLDGDGVPEVIHCERTENTFRIYWKKDKEGINWSEEKYQLPKSSGKAKSIEVADLDDDGIYDYIISTNTEGIDKCGLYWLSGKKLSTYSDNDFRCISGDHNAKFDKVEVLDLDNDGDLDILICEENYGKNSRGLGVVWYENTLNY